MNKSKKQNISKKQNFSKKQNRSKKNMKKQKGGTWKNEIPFILKNYFKNISENYEPGLINKILSNFTSEDKNKLDFKEIYNNYLKEEKQKLEKNLIEYTKEYDELLIQENKLKTQDNVSRRTRSNNKKTTEFNYEINKIVNRLRLLKKKITNIEDELKTKYKNI